MLRNRKTLFALTVLATALAACGSDDSPATNAAADAIQLNPGTAAPDNSTPDNSTPDSGANDGAANDGAVMNDPATNDPVMSDPGNPDSGGSSEPPMASPPDGSDTGTPGTTPATGYNYEVTFVNLTAGQPLSPPLVISHQPGFKLFTVGKPASRALEILAESGANDELAATANATGIVWNATSASGPIGPGQSATVAFTVPANTDLSTAYVSAASMLVNTNDAITAMKGISLYGLNANESQMVYLSSYDTGTEANSETAATIPGPAGGGEGYNSAREDIIDVVTGHPGVITADDGLASSALSSIHRWNNPVVRVTIRRTQ